MLPPPLSLPQEGHLGVLSGGHLLAQWFHGLAGPEQLQPEHVRQLLAYLLLAVPPPPPQQLPSLPSLPPGGLSGAAVPFSSQASSVAPGDVPDHKVLVGQSEQEGQQQQQQHAPAAVGVWPLRAVYASLRLRSVQATRSTGAATEAGAAMLDTCGAAAAGGRRGGEDMALPEQGQAPSTSGPAVCDSSTANPLAARTTLPASSSNTGPSIVSGSSSSSSIDEWTLRMIELVGLPGAPTPETPDVAAAAAAAEGAALDAAAHAAAAAANDAAGSDAGLCATATWDASAAGAAGSMSAAASGSHDVAANHVITTRGTTSNSSNSRGSAPAAPRLLAHTADPLVASYRPLTFYLLMEAVAAATHVALLGMGFRMAGLTPGRTAAVYEWAPRQRRAGNGSSSSEGHCGRANDVVPLMAAGVRKDGQALGAVGGGGQGEHEQEGEQGDEPVVFLHGIGMGLTPYLRLLGRLVAGGGGRRRVLAVQYKHVSMRFTTRIPAPHEVADDVAAFLRDRVSSALCVTACGYGVHASSLAFSSYVRSCGLPAGQVEME